MSNKMAIDFILNKEKKTRKPRNKMAVENLVNKEKKPRKPRTLKAPKPAKGPRKLNSWLQAVAEWRKTKSGKVLVPKKGTEEYDLIRKIQHQIIIGGGLGRTGVKGVEGL